jgi:hypothetical protein
VAPAVTEEEKAWVAYREKEIALYAKLIPASNDAMELELAIEHAHAVARIVSGE